MQMPKKVSKTWGEAYIYDACRNIPTCGTCGSIMMPNAKMLDAFFDWLKKRGQVFSGEDKRKIDEYDTMKELTRKATEESSRLKRKVGLLEEQFGEGYNKKEPE